jgi:tRNA modification GTPase
LSGADACAVASRLLTRRKPLEPRRATFTRVRGAAGSSSSESQPGSGAIDAVVVTWFPGPGSYTGEDVVEIGAHGSPVLLDCIVGSAVRARARGRGSRDLESSRCAHS